MTSGEGDRMTNSTSISKHQKRVYRILIVGITKKQDE